MRTGPFRETEVRLREDRELRRVLGLRSVSDYTTLYRFLNRLGEKTVNPALGEVARHLGVAALLRVGALESLWMQRVWRRVQSALSLVSVRQRPSGQGDGERTLWLCGHDLKVSTWSGDGHIQEIGERDGHC